MSEEIMGELWDTPGFLTETFKSRRIWENVFQALTSNYPDSTSNNPTKPNIKIKKIPYRYTQMFGF